MNIMVRFKRACAVLAAGATLAGGLALLPTVAQAVESKNVQTKAAGYKITFIDPSVDMEHPTEVTKTTDENGKLSPDQVPEVKVPNSLVDTMKGDGWSFEYGSPEPAIDFDTYVFTGDTTLYPRYAEKTPTTYNITFISTNPENPEDSYSQLLVTNSKRRLSEDPKIVDYDGYTFAGWYNTNGWGPLVPGAPYTSDTTFIAKYDKVTTPTQPDQPDQSGQTTPNQPDQSGQTAPVDNNTKQPAKDNKAPAKDPAKQDTKNNNTLAQTGADATAPLAIAAGLCLAAGITLGLRRKLAL